MKTIPEIRERLCQISAALIDLAKEVEDLAEETRRRSPVRRARREHAPLTQAQIMEVRRLRGLTPPVSQTRIAKMLGTNIGRVSEAERGFR